MIPTRRTYRQDRQRFDRTAGVSLLELLAVVAIVAILVGLLLPAVQSARESSRLATCKNHIRQIGLGLASHEGTNGHFPGGGWGFRWVGDPRSGSGEMQPGGFMFSVLPYLEAGNVHGIGGSGVGLAKAVALGKMLQMPAPILVCPSRRGVELRPFLGQYPLHNAVKPELAFKGDYAGCGGGERLKNGEGPRDDSPAGLRTYVWPHRKASGVFFAGSKIRVADITDGLSNTYLVGEKYVRMRQAKGPEDRDFGDDQAAYIGDDRDIRRWSEELPLRDQRDLDAPDAFGSRHPSTWNVLFADGSVRSLSYTIDPELHRTQGNRHDGQPGVAP